MVATWTSLPNLLDDTDAADPPEEGLEALLGALTAARPAWHARAACAGADVALFFPERQDPTGPARALCAGCPVTAECLAEALRHGETCPGIWGGTSGRERRQLRHQARTAA